ncbi:Polyadenylate-binding protein 2 [Platanthera guangdongensis]|uniref:Polyadenylate-binding protein 2 n=1 Tax=Platanthera guangdongensis TaxID=2320717 RepID=A0ABR2MW26_9ASPA
MYPPGNPDLDLFLLKSDVANLDKAIGNKALQDTFSIFGTVLSCKVATDPSGHSKGYGFVQFDSTEAAQNAIDKLNGMLLNDKQVYVGPFLRRQERENFLGKTKFSNVFVKNLSSSTTEEDLAKSFGEYGRTTSIVVMRDLDGKSKCFGFVNFENPDDAATAVQELNGKKMEDKEWYVGRAQKKTEREQELKTRFEQSITGTADKYQCVNLYLKNLDDSIGDEKLNELFSVFELEIKVLGYTAQYSATFAFICSSVIELLRTYVRYYACRQLSPRVASPLLRKLQPLNPSAFSICKQGVGGVCRGPGTFTRVTGPPSLPSARNVPGKLPEIAIAQRGIVV